MIYNFTTVIVYNSIVLRRYERHTGDVEFMTNREDDDILKWTLGERGL